MTHRYGTDMRYHKVRYGALAFSFTGTAALLYLFLMSLSTHFTRRYRRPRSAQDDRRAVQDLRPQSAGARTLPSRRRPQAPLPPVRIVVVDVSDCRAWAAHGKTAPRDILLSAYFDRFKSRCIQFSLNTLHLWLTSGRCCPVLKSSLLSPLAALGTT